MKLVYTGESIKETGDDFVLFLAGPTPRDKKTKSWRPDMIKTLRSSGFEGIVAIPEYRNATKEVAYNKRVKWEGLWLERANAILFWVPRDMKNMPALTTNIEFGEYMHSGKVILGYPKKAEHMDYMDIRATWLDIPIANDMKEAADIAINKEKVFLYACPKCYGSGQKDSNGTLYRCAKCEGTGFIEPLRKK
jgi:hypothetical protein